MSIKNILKRVLLILGVVLLISISIDLVGLLVASLTIQNMARQSVRFAATGQYYAAYCPGDDGSATWGAGCTGSHTDGDGGAILSTRSKEIDIARLHSIHDWADMNKGLLSINANATWNQPGYLHVVVCPNNIIKQPKSYKGPKAVFGPPSQGSFSAEAYGHCTLDGREREDPGDVSGCRDPNECGVVVMVDYNYPFFCPLLRIFGPYYHLTAARAALIEKFR